jgi:hypothetical protein
VGRADRHMGLLSMRTVHVNRVSPATILEGEGGESYLRGSVVHHTLEHSRIDQIK